MSHPRRVLCRVVYAALFALAVACVSTRPYHVLSDTGDPLRTQFNNDAGHIRIVMLVAPT